MEPVCKFDSLPPSRLRNLSRDMTKGKLLDFDRVSAYLRIVHRIGPNVDHALRVCAPLAWRIEIKFKEMIPLLKELIEKHEISKFEWIRIGEDASRALCCAPVDRFYTGTIPDLRFSMIHRGSGKIGFCAEIESGLRHTFRSKIETRWLTQIDCFLYTIQLYNRIKTLLLDELQACPVFKCACGLRLETDSLHICREGQGMRNNSNSCEFKIGDSYVSAVMGFVWLRITIGSQYFEANSYDGAPEFSAIVWSIEYQEARLLPLLTNEEEWINSIVKSCFEAPPGQ